LHGLKKSIGIFLLVVLIAPFLGTYVWLRHEKTLVRKAVKKQLIAGLDKKELIFLNFSKEAAQRELEWEHSKEFRYKNKMYDVVYSKADENSISYWCWLDKEETKLNKLLSDLVAKALGNDPLQKEKEKDFSDFTKSLFCSDQRGWFASIEISALFHRSTYYLHCYSWAISPPSPPPKLS
jgi:hypothetical protein